MKKNDNRAKLIPLGRVSRETRSIGGKVPELGNPIFTYDPA